MSFLEPLDEEGQQIYQDYLIHQEKWGNYIRSRAIKYLNNYLETTGKLYDQYEYLTENLLNTNLDSNSNSNSSNPDNVYIDKELTDKYKRLCVLFHPDKFINSSSTEFFTLITKFYKDGNKTIINAITTITDKILALPDNGNILSGICKTLTGNLIENQLNHLPTPWNADSIWNILNGSHQIDNPDCKYESRTDYSEFLESTAYTFYKGNKTSKNYIDSKYITESKLIEKIKNTPIFNQKFIFYCYHKYASKNDNIKKAIAEWLQNQNDLLETENAELRDKLNKLSNLE